MSDYKSPLSFFRKFFSSEAPPSKVMHNPSVVDAAVKGDREALARLAQEQGTSAGAGEVLSSAVNSPLSRRSFLRGAASAVASNVLDTGALRALASPKFDVYPALGRQFYEQVANEIVRGHLNKGFRMEDLAQDADDMPSSRRVNVEDIVRGITSQSQFRGYNAPDYMEVHDNFVGHFGADDHLYDFDDVLENMKKFNPNEALRAYKNHVVGNMIGDPDALEPVWRTAQHPKEFRHLTAGIKDQYDYMLERNAEEAVRDAAEGQKAPRRPVKEPVDPREAIVNAMRSRYGYPHDKGVFSLEPEVELASSRYSAGLDRSKESYKLNYHSLKNNWAHGNRTAVDPQGSMTSIEPAAPRRKLLPRLAKGGALNRCRDAK